MGCGKKSHVSRKSAKQSAKLQTKLSGYKIYIYYCKNCIAFHLTKQKQKKKKHGSKTQAEN